MLWLSSYLCVLSYQQLLVGPKTQLQNSEKVRCSAFMITYVR